MTHLRFVAASLVIAVAGLAACGGGDDEQEIRDVIERAVTTRDVKVECEETVTDGFVRRIYGDVAQCRRAERPEPDEEEADDVRVSNVKIDGDSATARVRLIGGDTDGARGTLELRKADGAWRVDDLGVDLLRSTVDRGLRNSGEGSLRRPAVQRCARSAFTSLSDRELRRVAYLAISEREGSEEALTSMLAPCLAIPGSAEGGGRISFLRERFEEGVERSLRRRGRSRAAVDCIKRRLRSTISDDEIAAAVRRGAAGASMRRKERAALRACR